MHPESRARRNVLFVLLLCLAGACLLVGVQLLAPGSITVEDQRGDSTIFFTADKSMVFGPTNCVNVSWRVEGIREIYFNRAADVGEGSRVMCVTNTEMPTLHIVFPDSSEQDYQLEIAFFLEQPGNWILLFVIVLLVLAILYFLAAPQFGEGAGQFAVVVRGLVRVFLLSLFSILITLLILEVALRFYVSNFGTRSQKIAYLYSREEINQLDPYAMPLPEIDYGLSPLHPEHNRLGYRGEDIEVPKPDGVFRIVAMGGSTTYGTSVQSDETYPYYLQQILREDYGYENVEVLNAGVFGYTSYQNLANLMFRIIELVPDLVIIYDNGNDILPREVDPECYRGDNVLLGLDPRGRVATSNYTQPLPSSVLYRFVTISLGIEVNPETLEGMFTYLDANCRSGQVLSPAEQVAANPPIYFERNLISMIGIARIHEFAIAFASWAYFEGSPEPADYWREAVAEHNEIIRRVTETYDVAFIDYAPAAPQEARYWADYVHMNAEGSRHQAEFFARFLDENGLLSGS